MRGLRRRLTQRLASMAIVLTLAVSVAVPAAPAQEDGQVFLWDDAEIWEGPWNGHIAASGDGTLLAQGIEFVYQTDVTGSLEMEASDDVVVGTFNVEGDYSMLGEQGNSTLVGVFDMVGSGEIVGTTTDLVMTGTAESDGIVEITVPGDKRTVPAGAPNDLKFHIDLEYALCNEVYASFTADLEARFEEIGWNPTMEGSVVMVQDAAIIQASIEEWTKGFKGEPNLTDSSAFPPGTPDIVKVVDSIVRRYNSWADQIDYSDLAAGADSWLTTRNLINDIEEIHWRLRSLSECEVGLLGDARDKFVTIVTRAMLATIAVVGEFKPDLSSGQLSQLSHMALSVGAFGRGSLAPAAEVVKAEQALQEAAVRILERWVHLEDPDCSGACIHMSQEAIEVLVVAAQLRWELVVEGKTIRPNDLLTRLGAGLSDSERLPVEGG